MNYTMLESVEDYAQEWFIADYLAQRNASGRILTPKNVNWAYREPRPCICTGGLPMIKPNCARHGHLVRRTGSWETWSK